MKRLLLFFMMSLSLQIYAGPEILQQGQYFFTVRTTSSSYYTLVFEVR